MGRSRAMGTRRRNLKRKAASASEAMPPPPPSSERNNRILKLESEEDRKILTKVKSEERKILKLKEEYMAASQAGLLDEVAPTMVPTVEAAQPAGKKTRKVLVKRLMTMTQAQIDFVKAMAVHPCPTRNLTEDQLAMLDQTSQDIYHRGMNIWNTRLAYFEALIDQQEKFGYAVEESEAEVTDDEDDDGTVVN